MAVDEVCDHTMAPLYYQIGAAKEGAGPFTEQTLREAPRWRPSSCSNTRNVASGTAASVTWVSAAPPGCSTRELCVSAMYTIPAHADDTLHGRRRMGDDPVPPKLHRTLTHAPG